MCDARGEGVAEVPYGVYWWVADNPCTAHRWTRRDCKCRWHDPDYLKADHLPMPRKESSSPN